MKLRDRNTLLLAAILLLALILRLWGINFGLPYLYHPDEPRYVLSAQLLFKTLNLDPNALPDIASSSLVYVVNALAYAPYYLLGYWAGVFQTPLDIPAPQIVAMGSGRITLPSAFLLGRLVTLVAGLANVVLVYLIGRHWLQSATAGLLAALMLALSPSHVINSRYVTPDTFVVFFVLVAFLAAASIYQTGRPRAYVLAGIALGCLASTKVSGGLILLPVLAAHFLRPGARGLNIANLVRLGLAGAAAFLLTSPYILVDAFDVVDDILFEGRHYAAGHFGMEGDSLAWYVQNAWQTMGVFALMAVAEIVRGAWTRSWPLIVLSIYPVISFAFISSFVTRNDRTFLPLTPFMFLLAASFLLFLLARASQAPTSGQRTGAIVAVAGLALAGFLAPLARTVADTRQLLVVDSRATARTWIEQHLPPGAKVAVESYAPFIDPTRFTTQGFLRLTLQDSEWYKDNGFDYLIFSQGMYGRFFADPQRYEREIALYNRLFDGLPLVKLFVDGGYEVRIYAVPD